MAIIIHLKNKATLMNYFRFLAVIILTSCLVSCGSQRKTQAYYLDRSIDTLPQSFVVPELRIQKNDLLSIQVYSASTRPEADALYNLPLDADGQLSGFLVDNLGNIEYPRLGTIHVEGLNKQELATLIRQKLVEPVELLKDPSVIIRFLNIRFTVLGNVAREGMLTIPGERLTILEAIGLAGGITYYGRKDQVKVIREKDGMREIGYVNLSSDSLFTSPYYNIAQNDVVLVQPTGKQEKDADQARVAQRISFALTLVTVAATLYNIFKN
jgi:polysaccharide export outer membrane protein